MYIILNKETGHIINDHPRAIDPELKSEDIYPDFDPQTMEILCTDLPPDKVIVHYNNFLGHFNVGENGLIIEKSLKEKIAARSVKFDPELLKEHAIFDDTLASKSEAMRIVELAIRLKMLKTIKDCEAALTILEDELEETIAQKYRQGYELKLMKSYMEWIEEGKPENDSRQTSYLEMKANIDAVKNEYRLIRTEVKELEEELNRLISSKPDSSWQKEKIIEYLDAKELLYDLNATKDELLKKIEELANSSDTKLGL